jgi:hypothetical protein
MCERAGLRPCLFVCRIGVSGEKMKRVVALVKRVGRDRAGTAPDRLRGRMRGDVARLKTGTLARVARAL